MSRTPGPAPAARLVESIATLAAFRHRGGHRA